MQAQSPTRIDGLQAGLPSFLKWCFASAGAAAGWYYARTDATPIPLSYIALGGAVGYGLIAGAFAGLRLLKLALIAGAMLLILNFAVLIPFGFGNYLPAWLDAGKAALRWLDPLPLARRWGKSVEVRPPGL